jgi:hypothetical protein
MNATALSTDGRSRFVASDRTGRPWTTLAAVRSTRMATGSTSLFPHYVREAAHRASTSVIKIIGHYHQFARAGSGAPSTDGVERPVWLQKACAHMSHTTLKDTKNRLIRKHYCSASP